jgi:predicted phosphodiesterase
MRICAISDLHIGTGDRTDRFGHAMPEFHRFLDDMERRSDRIVLVGDILDTHHGVVPFDFFGEVRRAAAAYPGLVDRLLSGAYHIVSGNHDECLETLPGAGSLKTIDADGTRVILLHGHQYDRLIRWAPHVCAVGNWAGGRFEAAGMPGALRFLDRFDDWANNGVQRSRTDIYRDRAVALGAEHRAAVVVMGHLHKQDLHRDRGVTYVNCGSCVQGRFEFALIDTATGGAEVGRW